MPRILFRAQLGDQQEVGPGLWTAARHLPRARRLAVKPGRVGS